MDKLERIDSLIQRKKNLVKQLKKEIASLEEAKRSVYFYLMNDSGKGIY